jgi:hypothetical protein
MFISIRNDLELETLGLSKQREHATDSKTNVLQAI